MTFEEAYNKIEKKFQRQVEIDNETLGIESIYLPNMMPAGPVDYVLVGMEPSLKGFAKDIQDAKWLIEKGFRNFCCVWQIHFPVQEYLCQDGETYHLTDLAKGSMETTAVGAGNKNKYKAWYPLLEEELSLVAKPDAKIISIGGKVGGFLLEKGLYGHAGTVPHFASWAKDFGKEIDGPEKEEEYKEFAAKLKTIPRYYRKRGHSCETDHVARDFPLVDSKKRMLFDYKVRFRRIRDQESSGWRQRQRERQASTDTA